MARLRLKYIREFVDRHGKTRRYFKHPKTENIPLYGEPGSTTFRLGYEAAFARIETPRVDPLTKRIPGSLDELVDLYFASPAFTNLAPITQATYRNEIIRLCRNHGRKPVVMLDRRGVLKIVSERKTPGAQNQVLKIVRLLMRFAITVEMRKDDPTLAMKKAKTKGDGYIAWEEEDIEKFEKRHSIGTKARLALALLLYTAQRRSDVVRMGRQHLRPGGLIRVRQSKTNALLDIPLHPDLAAVLEASPTGDLTFLVTEYGAAFAPAGFGNWFRERCAEANLPKGYNAHGLRKAACRRLAEADCTAFQIMAISGHKNIEEVETYIRSVNQAKLARVAIGRLANPVANFPISA